MAQFDEKKSRQMELMLAPAQERLKLYNPEDLCKKGSIQFDKENNQFVVESMNQKIYVSYPEYVIDQDLDMWHYLTILQYMDTADGSPLSGEYIGLAQMRDGLSRGRGYDTDISTMFAHDFIDVEADDFASACEKLGGKLVKSKADVTAVIHYAPMFPVMINFYEGDDEFKPSGKMLVDKHADHYLTVEAAGGACSAVLAMIRKNLKT